MLLYKTNKTICLRSTWEAKVSKYLDEQNILWSYETELIDVEYMLNGLIKKSTIDLIFFFLKKKYIEVKGMWYNGYKEKFLAAQQKITIPIELWDKIF